MKGYSKRARASMGDNEGAEIHFKDFEKRFWNGEDPAYDGAFWHDRLPLSWSKDIVENGIPVLQWGGWQDLNETGAIRGYVAFQNAMAGRDIHLPMAKDQKASPRYQLIIGDWGHGIGMDIGVYLEWFDTWLKNADTGLLETSTPLHFYEVGTNRWVNLAEYPSVDTYTTWYLGQNTMEEKRPAQGESVLRWGSPEAADGKLIFDSMPSAEGMTIAGPLSLQLYAKSSNTNMEVLARLYDVDADGKAVMITKGALLGSLSKLDEKSSWKDSDGKYTWPWPLLDRDRYAKPGEVHRYEMALEPIQYGIKPGHKVRLILSRQSLGNDSAQGFFVAEPSSLTAPQQKTVPGGVYTILFGDKTPTSLNLPLLPYQFYPEARAASNPTSWSEMTRDFDATGYTIPVEW